MTRVEEQILRNQIAIMETLSDISGVSWSRLEPLIDSAQQFLEMERNKSDDRG